MMPAKMPLSWLVLSRKTQRAGLGSYVQKSYAKYHTGGQLPAVLTPQPRSSLKPFHREDAKHASQLTLSVQHTRSQV